MEDARIRLRDLRRRLLSLDEQTVTNGDSKPDLDRLNRTIDLLRRQIEETQLEIHKGLTVVLQHSKNIADLERQLEAPNAEPRKVRPGDVLMIEVLEALPGRPITGERLVRPDGTISLGFYGNLFVAGLNRDQIKVTLIEHLRQTLSDESLGLVEQDAQGRTITTDPVRSDRVFVDDSPSLARDHPTDRRVEDLEHKLDRVLDELEALRRRPTPEE